MINHQQTRNATLAKARKWGRVSTAEPRLLHVEAAVRTARRLAQRRRSACANALWFGYSRFPSLHARMTDLVGWGRPGPPDPYLSSSEAYDAAYAYLYDLLPDCRNCGCITREDLQRSPRGPQPAGGR